MGACASQQARRSDAIDRQLAEDAKRYKGECKILLLGSGESGKSTIVGQMKIIHQEGFSGAERMAFRAVIRGNAVDSAGAVARAVRRCGMEGALGEEGRGAVGVIIGVVGEEDEEEEGGQPGEGKKVELGREMADAIEVLWRDPVVARVLDEHGSEFYLMDSAAYFISAIQRLADPEYTPTEEDVLRARAQSTGITETRFNMGGFPIRMFDVGGQRSERRKWIHCFESVTSIIFCTALSEYDQVLLDEKGQTRLRTSLTLFDTILTSPCFPRTPVILFLNKVDVFRGKLRRVPLERYLPEYTGGPDINQAAKCILWRFMQGNRARVNVYPYLTQATDTNNVRVVFATVKDTILRSAVKDSAIL
ncbi:G-protein alpha subunit [Mycena galericulata]|nr:G-protein alpha subunit [Mycena galericulata]